MFKHALSRERAVKYTLQKNCIFSIRNIFVRRFIRFSSYQNNQAQKKRKELITSHCFTQRSTVFSLIHRKTERASGF